MAVSEPPTSGGPEEIGPAARRDPEVVTRERRWSEVPLAFVVVVLAVLAVSPIVLERRTEPLQEEIENAIEPAHVLAEQVQTSLATELSLLRGYLLTGDELLLERYEDVRATHQVLYERLDPLVERLGPEAADEFANLRELVERRHEPVDPLLRREIERADFIELLPARQILFEESILASTRFQAALLAREQEVRGQIQEVRRINRAITLALVLLALAASLIVARIARSLRAQAGEELALRRVAHALTRSLDAQETLALIASNALRLTRADGSHVERADRKSDQVEVVATAGRQSLPSGTVLPFPGSLTHEMLAHGAPHRVRDLAGSGTPAQQHFARHCRGCSGLVVPLRTGTEVTGSLVLVRRRRRHGFSNNEVLRACTLADLASLSLRKILLLEEAQRHRAEMEQHLATRTRLIRGISHDLKNPLGAADGYAELLEAELQGELTEGQKEYVGRIRRMHRTVLEIVEYLLDLARSEGESLRVQRGTTDLGGLVREVVEDYRARARLADLHMRLSIAADVPPIDTDRSRVREILGNLLSNAIKYSEPGDAISVRVEPERDPERTAGPCIAIHVEDTGPGIRSEDQERIFVEYQRLDEGRANGAGIGLSISRKVARLLGGDIVVSSVPGEGSRFTLRLPAPPAPPPQRRAAGA
jgi:signal transduction histidine kinase/CHASE3 domain sensor protein